MVDKIIAPDGALYQGQDEVTQLAGQAVILRDQARARGQPDPIYIDQETGETVLPRKGHTTRLSHAENHFFHPSKERTSSSSKRMSKALDSLEDALKDTGNFTDFKKGKPYFKDYSLELKTSSWFLCQGSYDFHMLFARNKEGNQYGFLVMNSVPNSDKYIALLKMLSNTKNFEDGPRIQKQVLEKSGVVRDLDDKIHIVTVQIKNKHLYRPNNEARHPENAITLGDWQVKHLSALYPEFVYFDPKTKKLEVVRLERFPHQCSYSNYRYAFKNQTPPRRQGPLYCQQAIPAFEGQHLTAEPLKVKQNSASEAIGKHPPLYLARLTPHQQMNLRL